MEPKIHTSPSGKYKLEVTSQETKPGCWNYTTGAISRDDKPLLSVQRNYSSFPFLWVEGHPDGHDYLVCGSDYQGQTVIRLDGDDENRRKDTRPEEAKKGHGFCWVWYQFDAKNRMLVVDGCIWACPYETRFYDFADPMGKGISEIPFEGKLYADSEDKNPTINEDGTVTTWESRQDEVDEGDDPPPRVVASKTWKRDGDLIRLVSEWIDPEEAKLREENRIAREKWEKEWEEYKKTDPLFLRFRERAKQGEYPSYGVGLGQCYEGWSPTFKGTDSRLCATVARGKVVEGVKFTIEVQWGRKEAPILLEVYRDSKKDPDVWFERSLENLDKAFDVAESLIRPTPTLLERVKGFFAPAE